jgi:phage terminase large subunit GpA-like protein
MVNVGALKQETYGWLELTGSGPGEAVPPGWISLPAVGDEVLRQLCAEQLVRKVVRGVERAEWQKIYNRNEALDARVLARAAAHLVGMDRFTDDDWRQLEAPFGIPPAPPETPPPSAPPPSAPTVPAPGAGAPHPGWRRSTWWDRPRR